MKFKYLLAVFIKNTSVENDRESDSAHLRVKSGSISPSEIGSLRFDV